jgi:PIN domain nuclease of toxin-antitoxin system
VKLLLDTHIVIWAALGSPRMPAAARDLIQDHNNLLYVSAATYWEIAIKQAQGRADFVVNLVMLRQGLLAAGYRECAIEPAHAIAARALPPLHKDPFDRVLVAQAKAEEMVLVTADVTVAQYAGTIVKV